jgi:hypothetical protein
MYSVDGSTGNRRSHSRSGTRDGRGSAGARDFNMTLMETRLREELEAKFFER